jgi:hypothetical protein
MWIREAEWKAKESHNYEQFNHDEQHESDDDGTWGIPKDDSHRVEWEASESRVSVSYPASHRGWPSVEGGVEVSIEISSDLKDSEEECPACRLPMFIDRLSVPDLLSFLCHSTVGTSIGSCASPRSRC